MAARPPRLRMCSAARDVSVISIQPTLYGKQQLTFLPFGKSIIYASMKPHTKQLKGSQNKAMGMFYVTIGVGHPEGGDLTEVSAMVDTGATHTMLPESLLEQLHIQPLVQRRFGIADSNERLWGVGQARIAYQDEDLPDYFRPRRAVSTRGDHAGGLRSGGRPQRQGTGPGRTRGKTVLAGSQGGRAGAGLLNFLDDLTERRR